MNESVLELDRRELLRGGARRVTLGLLAGGAILLTLRNAQGAGCRTPTACAACGVRDECGRAAPASETGEARDPETRSDRP